MRCKNSKTKISQDTRHQVEVTGNAKIAEEGFYKVLNLCIEETTTKEFHKVRTAWNVKATEKVFHKVQATCNLEL